MSDELARRKAPCKTCPWRRDVESGAFGVERYEQLQNTVRRGEQSPVIGDPMFACHQSVVGDEAACAGWLAVEGYQHLGVRYAISVRRLDPAALRPGADWPPLWSSFDEMVEHMAGEEGACRIQPPTRRP